MRVWAFSDLHLPTADVEVSRVLGNIPQADVCVCAGDIVEGDAVASVHWLAENIRPAMEVCCVLGNHEFYQDNGQDRVRSQARAAALQAGIHLLDDTSADIAGFRVLGSTLWSDFDIHAGGDEIARAYAMHAVVGMRDYDYPAVDGRSERWSPSHARRQHIESRTFLERELAAAHGPVVVVTHHAPHPDSISVEFERDLATGAYVSDLSDLIGRHQPALWVHGHTHAVFEYRAGATRIICNPRGHGDVRRFDPGLVLELETATTC